MRKLTNTEKIKANEKKIKALEKEIETLKKEGRQNHEEPFDHQDLEEYYEGHAGCH